MEGAWRRSLTSCSKVDSPSWEFIHVPVGLSPWAKSVSVDLCSPDVSKAVSWPFKSLPYGVLLIVLCLGSSIPPLLFQLLTVTLCYPACPAGTPAAISSYSCPCRRKYEIFWFSGFFGLVECVWVRLRVRPLSLYYVVNCLVSLFVLSTESTDNFVSSKCLLALWVLCFVVSPAPLWLKCSWRKNQEPKRKLIEAAQSPGVPMHEQDDWGASDELDSL